MLSRQLEEIYMLKCSLMGNEIMVFDEYHKVWESLVDEYAENGQVSQTTQRVPCQFVIKLEKFDVWINIGLSLGYPEDGHAVVSVKGDRLTRSNQERWQRIIDSTLGDLITNSSEFPIFELVSIHLLPLLHQEAADSINDIATQTSVPNSSTVGPVSRYHALLSSHHLISPNKRRSLQRWSSELSLIGFAKVGYPGVIYFEGEKGNVEEFVGKVKSMQWLALRVRFVDELSENEPLEMTGEGQRRHWIELEKVGEVVEYMRHIGREKYVLDIGLGAGASNSQ